MLRYLNHRHIKLFILLVFISGSGLAVVNAQSDPNPDSNYPVEVTVSAASAPADGVSKITVSLFIYGYKCDGQEELQETSNCTDGTKSTQKVALPNRWIGVYTTGSGNIYTNLNTPVGVQYVTSGADGRASFQMASTVAETKNLQFCDHVRGVAPPGATSQSIAFTPVRAIELNKGSIEPPVLNKVNVDGHEINFDTQLTITTDQKLTLFGTAKPESVVTLEINSEPKQIANVDVSSDGTWMHEFIGFITGIFSIKGTTKENIKADPSAQVTLLSFSATGKPSPAISAKENSPPKNSNYLMLILSLILMLTIAVLIYFKRDGIKQRVKRIIKSKPE
jgi:hypothetical protein